MSVKDPKFTITLEGIETEESDIRKILGISKERDEFFIKSMWKKMMTHERHSLLLKDLVEECETFQEAIYVSYIYGRFTEHVENSIQEVYSELAAAFRGHGNPLGIKVPKFSEN